MSKGDCLNLPAVTRFERIEKLSFDCIPHQSKLFLDYLKNPLALGKFYPTPLRSHVDVPSRMPEVLENYRINRNQLADALQAMNKRWRANRQTLENIEKLRQNDSVAVVTGQQAGIFTGALYTIYKAISAIKAAACYRGRGINAVPVFWIATEDHDFAEIAETFIQNGRGCLSKVTMSAAPETAGLPVGKIPLDDSIGESVEHLFAELPKTEFSGDLEDLVREAYQPGRSVGDAFALVMSRFFGEYGLVLFDPLDEKLKQLAAPIYLEAIEKSEEITSALLARSRELESGGYHAQILVDEFSFPLFWLDEAGKRHALRRGTDGKLSARGNEKQFEIEELKELARNAPERLSPNATFRNVVQDYLLPTVVYFGGAAEIAYSAQNAEVYRVLQRPVTPMLARASATVIESRVRRTLDKYNLRMADFFCRPENLLPRIVEEFLDSETAGIFAEAEETINARLDRLDARLTEIEPTLATALAHRRPKILYHIQALKRKFYNAQMQRHETVKRQLEAACSSLFPHKGLQERKLNVTSLIARHGEYILQWLYDEIDIDTPEHQIFYL
ncbi:MAG: bacillithiol biosynthesis cysteine-adding enzyme BshC [Acidobacteriota bacterium]|nr:bacillithiol biosynthesis cysteine-adding enzyme BshC [Acidobacteriota bacterium]